jgi:hypothetical protein
VISLKFMAAFVSALHTDRSSAITTMGSEAYCVVVVGDGDGDDDQSRLMNDVGVVAAMAPTTARDDHDIGTLVCETQLPITSTCPNDNHGRARGRRRFGPVHQYAHHGHFCIVLLWWRTNNQDQKGFGQWSRPQ